jgi:transposase-like protein
MDTAFFLKNAVLFKSLEGLRIVIEEYVHLMKKYVEKLKPNVGDIWRADELWLKVKGDIKYLH